MKYKLAAFAISLILSFSLSFSAVMCLVTGFDLPVDSIPRLTGVCFAAALGCSIGFSLERGAPALVMLIAFGSGYLGRHTLPLQQLLFLVQHISQIYDNAYHWGALALITSPQNVDFPLFLLGCLSSLALSFWLCRGKGLILALMPVLLMLLSCLVVTNTLPDRKYLFLILAGIAILLLSAPLRWQDMRQSNRLVFMSTLPILTALGFLFLLVPQYNYVNRSDVLLQRIASLGQAIPGKIESAISVLLSPSFSETIDLTRLPVQPPSAVPVMTVTAPHTGELYLRGQSYDRYTGSGWIAEDDPAAVSFSRQPGADQIRIHTHQVQTVLYVPCYPTQPVPLSGRWISNPERLREYAFSMDARDCQPIPPVEESLFLALPEAVENAARILLKTIGNDSTAIAEFVRSSAVYDRNPDVFPKGEPDFALWFLQEADRGYCVHFATAAVVLLRSAGIPARYVTGFLADVEAGKPTVLTSENAHAWAEYYDHQQNTWRILEATPAASPPVSSQSAGETLPAVKSTQLQGDRQPAQRETTPLPAAETPQSQTFSMNNMPLFYLALLCLSRAALSIQRRIRIALRHGRRGRGSANQQAMARWKEAEFLSRLLKQPPTEEILALGYKAWFSQHQLTEEELSLFDSYLRACRQQLGKKRWYIRFVHKYLFAAY